MPNQRRRHGSRFGAARKLWPTCLVVAGEMCGVCSVCVCVCVCGDVMECEFELVVSLISSFDEWSGVM